MDGGGPSIGLHDTSVTCHRPAVLAGYYRILRMLKT
jgi:hypothetical protein